LIRGEGGIELRRSLLAFVVLACLLCVPLASAQGVTVNIAYKHVSLELPADWLYERNYSFTGITYDLYMEGPDDGSLIPPYGCMMMSAWLGVVSQSSMWATFKSGLDDLKSDPDMTGVVVVSAPTNKTLGDIPAIDCTLRYTVSGMALEMRMIMAVSDDWNLEYDMVFVDEASDWSASSADINSIVNSFTVAQKQTTGGDGGIDTTVLAIAAIAVVLIVVVVVVVLLLMQKKKEPVPMMPPPVQPGYAPPPAQMTPPEPPKAP